VLDAAETVDTTAVKKRLATFKASHASYAAAETAVRGAEEKLRKAEAVVGERDVDQDDAVDGLANALIQDGEPRTNAFKSFGFAAPGAVKTMAYAEEAKTIGRLVVAVRKRKGLSKETLATVTTVESAAREVEKAIQAVEPFQKAHASAIARREALAHPWEKAFAALKRGARAAEDEGAVGLFAVLFQQNAPRGATPRTAAKRGERKAQKQAEAEAKRAAKAAAAAAAARVWAARQALVEARARLKAARDEDVRARGGEDGGEAGRGPRRAGGGRRSGAGGEEGVAGAHRGGLTRQSGGGNVKHGRSLARVHRARLDARAG
jgi:hypothetical protein